MNRTDDFQRIQTLVSSLPSEQKGQISDGYHTFLELYSHRIENFIALCRVIHFSNYKEFDGWSESPVWRTKAHSDGSVWPGWFILGIGKENGKQMTYHLPENCWDRTGFATTLDKAPEWDGHTSEDVLERLKNL